MMRLLFLTLILFGLTSCESIFLGMYGLKNIKTIEEKTIERFAEKYNIPEADNYELDTSYISYLLSFDTSQYNAEIKNHYQPLQALYYDSSGNLISFQINCYAGGFPNLEWDRDEIMTTFPPKEQAPLDSILPLETHLNFLNQLSKSDKISVDQYDYLVVVYWSRFMGRQSKRLIRYVQKNRELISDKEVKIIYVNTDNLFTNG